MIRAPGNAPNRFRSRALDPSIQSRRRTPRPRPTRVPPFAWEANFSPNEARVNAHPVPRPGRRALRSVWHLRRHLPAAGHCEVSGTSGGTSPLPPPCPAPGTSRRRQRLPAAAPPRGEVSGTSRRRDTCEVSGTSRRAAPPGGHLPAAQGPAPPGPAGGHLPARRATRAKCLAPPGAAPAPPGGADPLRLPVRVAPEEEPVLGHGDQRGFVGVDEEASLVAGRGRAGERDAGVAPIGETPGVAGRRHRVDTDSLVADPRVDGARAVRGGAEHGGRAQHGGRAGA